MKKILLLTAIAISSFVSKATPGDTTIVPVHILDSLTYYGTYTRSAQLPTANVTYRKIYFLYTIGRYQCPAGSQYCGQWDYSLDFIAKPLNPAVSTEEYEIARGITPYAGTGSVFNTAWTNTYYIDVTDFAPILKDSLELLANYSGYSGGFTLESQLMFIEGTPAKEPVSIHKVQRGYYAYGGATSIETNLIPDTTQIIAPATNADMLVSITGHGSDNTGCSEFCEKYYTINLNGTQISQVDFWKKCGFCDIQAQTGTWVYDRGGWCPGEKVLARRHPLAGITPSTPFVVDMDLETYSGSGGAGYSVASYVIGYKDPSFTLDAELEDIISPSKRDDYKKYNPNCTNPMVVIKNAGTTDLTAVTIRYGVKGQLVNTYKWTGNLKFLQSAIVTLPSIAWGNLLSDSSEFIAMVENPNDAADQYAMNDTIRSMFVNSPSLQSDLIFRLKTNNTAVTSGGTYNETSWKLYDANNNVIRERINNANNTQYDDTLSLVPGCYHLEMFDEGWEDGLNWWVYPNYPTNPGVGFFQIRNALTGSIFTNTVTKLNSKYYNGDFGSKFVYNFKVNFPTGTTLIEKSNFEVNLFPNPASDVLHVELHGIESETSIALLNINGEVLAQQYVHKDGIQSFALQNLAKGMYFVKISDKNHVEVRKVVVSGN